MEDQAQSLIDATTAAFKAGRLPGGATIPPPVVSNNSLRIYYLAALYLKLDDA